MSYSREQIDELKSKINYEEFFKKYLPDLQQKGSKYWACCCFHSEQKPSLCVDVNLGLWRCFGACNEGGDAIKFYEKYFSVSFSEAVQAIAEMYDFELEMSDEEREFRDECNKIYELNKIVADKAMDILESDEEAWNYVTKIRGISPKMIEIFKIGRGGNVPVTEGTIKAGLVGQKNGKYFTYLRNNRILFPRFNEYGKIISFTGRLFTDEDWAKYLHLPDTQVYSKSDNLYGLYQAKKYIKHFKSAILVEGQIDCIKCHQKGFVNTVALDGLRISDAQVNQLKKYTSTFYICVEDSAILTPNAENDTALDLLYKNIKHFIPYAKVYVIDLRKQDGSKCDPDMYLSEHTKEEFKDLIQHAHIYNEFLINEKIKNINPKNIEEKNACIKSLIPILVGIQSYMDRKAYIELVANKLLMPENDIYKLIKKHNEFKDKELNRNIEYESRPIYAQKILLSMNFCPNFYAKKVAFLIKNNAEEKMEYLYRHIFKDYIEPYIMNYDGDKVDFTDFFSNIQHNNKVDELTKNILLDSYMKTEMLEDFEDEDIEELINEQVETLSEYVVSQTNDIELDI